MAGQATSQVQETETVYRNVWGILKLCLEIIQKFADRECQDKQPNETYKQYCERLQKISFTPRQWKILCTFSADVFDRETKTNDMDVTALGHLFNVVPKSKGKVLPASFTAALSELKKLRNQVMHNITAARDSATLGMLESALIAFIREASAVYSLSKTETQALSDQVKTDIQAGFSPGMEGLIYAKACMVEEGQKSMEIFLRNNFETENLMFSMGKVERRAVFHGLEVLLRKGKVGKTFFYTKIFEYSEKFIIVSGEAGAGKSTLLKNIALQFADQQSRTLAHLQDFDLLVYIQCRDHTTQTLSQVLTQQFGDLQTKLGEDTALGALHKLEVFFLIDGFDEYSSPMTVLQEVIKKAKQANWLVIITSRPYALGQLTQLLSNENVHCAEFEIVPLTKLEQQLNFLAKYEPHLRGPPPAGAVQERFQTLPHPVRILFTEPLRLLHFLWFCINKPEIIATWTSAADVAKATYRIYIELMTKKMVNVNNLPIVIEDVMLVIGDHALEFISNNTLLIPEEKLKKLRSKVHDMLREKHDLKTLDVDQIFTCVLKTRRPLIGTGHTTSSFHHKSDQELLASRSVARRMRDGKSSVREILTGGNSRIDKVFLEVLQHVVQELSADTPDLFEQRWPELKEALQEAGADFSTWRDLVLSCSDQGGVVRRLAEAAGACEEWMIVNGRHVSAVALMLPHAQPRLLGVLCSPDVLREAHWTVRQEGPTPWEEVARLREGKLKLHFHDEAPCDDLLTPLRGTRAQLEMFRGIIAGAEGAGALCAIAAPASSLTVRLLTPVSLCALQGRRCAHLGVTVPLIGAADGGPWPLPADPRPVLVVVDDQSGVAWRDVVRTVLSYAPAGGRYREVSLRGLRLSAPDLDMTAAELQQHGVRTEDEGTTRWEETTVHWIRLFITDALPEHLAALSVDKKRPCVLL